MSAMIATLFMKITIKKVDTLYRLESLPVDPKVAQKAWRMIGEGEVSYDVAVDARGYASCTCLGFARHEHCKHVASLQEKGLLPKSR